MASGAARNEGADPTAYFLAAAKPPRAPTVSARLARCDPNVPRAMSACVQAERAVGISYDDGSFEYWRTDGDARLRLQLYAAAVPLMRAADDVTEVMPISAAAAPPCPVTTPWSLWAFLPKSMHEVLFCHVHSNQLFSCRLPVGNVLPAASSAKTSVAGVMSAERVWALAHAASAAPITALAISADGNHAGIGFGDGTIAFWQLQQPAAGLDHLAERLPHAPCAHKAAHGAPVTAMAMLADGLIDAAVQTALCASGGADQSILVFDLRSSARLFSLLTPTGSPVSAFHLRIVPPHHVASSSATSAEPSVLLVAGASDGGVQACNECINACNEHFHVLRVATRRAVESISIPWHHGHPDVGPQQRSRAGVRRAGLISLDVSVYLGRLQS